MKNRANAFTNLQISQKPTGSFAEKLGASLEQFEMVVWRCYLEKYLGFGDSKTS